MDCLLMDLSQINISVLVYTTRSVGVFIWNDFWIMLVDLFSRVVQVVSEVIHY